MSLATACVVLFAIPLPAQAAATGSIAGKVTSAANGAAIAGVCVVVHPLSAGASNGLAYTDSDGSYVASGLADGSYNVQFEPQCTTPLPYSPQAYRGQADVSTAATVTVSGGGATTGIDAAFAASRGITGTVTDIHGLPVSGTCVQVDGRWQQQATTDAQGRYDIAALAPGTFSVKFADCSSAYAVQFYNNIYDATKATRVSVQAATATPGIDATLHRASTISGTLTHAADGTPAANVYVSAFGPVGTPITVTDANGHYSLTKLAPGDYHVWFQNSVFSDGYATRRSSGVADTVYSATGS